MMLVRWQEIKDVLHQALELSPEHRSAFVDRVCTDDSMRRELESLLSAGEEVRSSFLNSGALSTSLTKGTKIGDYEIVELIGAGGMGEVYRAHDLRLHRDVAIKILPAFVENDADRLSRFEQEARAAAALNHPNILAIFQMGTYAGIPYLVSELLEGSTMRARLLGGSLPVREAVGHAIQICRGLAAAHERGIIHRDLKPENLFITKQGVVKVLDFGLAKLNSFEHGVSLPSTATQPGMIMGTIGYMSPEQVRGHGGDHRSDIFALGAIIYEMLTGERAFAGQTPADGINAILNLDPKALSDPKAAIPPLLKRILSRCLEKNANERFHSARDVAYALEAISDAPSFDRESKQTTLLHYETARGANRRLHSLAYWAAGVGAVTLLVAAGFFYYQEKPKAQMAEWEQLTDFPDAVMSPALSPDGRMLAFLHGPGTFATHGDLFVKMLPNGEPVQLTHDNALKTNPAFTPDGANVTYTTPPNWDTWIVPVLGGKNRLMLPNASGLSWIDDRHILFSEIKQGVHMAVVTASESRAEERDVYVPPTAEGMAHRSYISPDHKWVLIASEMAPSNLLPCRLVPFDGSSAGRTVGPAGSSCSYSGWSPDGKWMFFTADTGTGFHVWRQRFPDGKPEQLTFGPTEQEGISVSPDGRSLLSAVSIETSTIWVHDKSRERQISFEGSAYLLGDQTSSRAIFSPDATKLYFLGKHNPGGPAELWVADLTSGLAERVLPGLSIANAYDISPDGKQITFDALDGHGQPHIWIASRDRRSPPRVLESNLPETNPIFGPGGDILFRAQGEQHSYLYRRAIAGGERRRAISDPVVRLETVSPDGNWIVAEAPVENEQVTRGVIAFRLDGVGKKRVCHNLCSVRWTLDGKYLFMELPWIGSTKSFAIPLRPGESFPDLPPGGIDSEDDLVHLSGAIRTRGFAVPGADSGNTVPGPDVDHYAFTQSAVHRNIYRVPLR